MKTKNTKPEAQPMVEAAATVVAGDKGKFRYRKPGSDHSLYIVGECLETYSPRPNVVVVSLKFFNHSTKEVDVWNINANNITLLK